jgi:4-hydroxymandelate oxidase
MPAVAKDKDRPRRTARLLTVEDWEKAARQRLSRAAYDYFRSGADDERTLKRNVRAYREWVIWYRVLRDVSERSLTTTVLGQEVRSPILIAPTAYHRMAHPDGELATARAAATRGTILVASTLATTTLEAIAEATPAPKWFQLYVHKDRGFTRALVERAEAAGYDAIVVTVDTPVLGRRLRDERGGFNLPAGLRMENLVAAVQAGEGESPAAEAAQASMLASYVAERHDASLGFDDLAWLRELSHLPVVVKGVVRADDAARCVAAGVAGIIVSNHGGRQLDGAPATIEALPGVVEAVEGRAEVLVDGGIRRGTDVLKALALGARAVLVGRPVLWGLAVGGEEGVAAVLELLDAELARAMALAGCARVEEIDRSLVARG